MWPAVDFAEGGKPEYPEKNPRSQIEIDKSQPTCGARESNLGRRGGKHQWWPLRQSDSPNIFYIKWIVGSSFTALKLEISKTPVELTQVVSSIDKFWNADELLFPKSSCQVLFTKWSVKFKVWYEASVKTKRNTFSFLLVGSIRSH